MKKPLVANSILGLVFAVILNLLIPASAQAAIVLKVSYSSDDSYFNYGDSIDTEEEWGLWTETCKVGSACAKKNRSITDTVARSRAIKMCKTLDGYGARIKVVNGSSATAGLGNLYTVSIVGLKKYIEIQNLPDYYSDEDEDYYSEEDEDSGYVSEEDDPEYIKNGYEYIYWEGTCRYSGNVSLISSSFYTIYIDGGRGPEYSRAELTKLKWRIFLVDN
jgi:hypothetical protein